MKKGFQQFTVRELIKDKAEMRSVLGKVKALGYDSIHGYVLPFITLQEYRDMLAEIGLENCSANGDFAAMRKSDEAIEKAINDANFLGNDQIALATLPEEWRESRDGFKQYAAEINKIAAKVKKAGKKLVYHPHAVEFFSLGGGLKGMDIMLDETDPEGFWFCLDTHWMASGGVNPVDWIKKVKGRASLVHFKDYAIVSGATHFEQVCRQFAEVGEGNLNWPAIIAACKEIGIEHAIVEQDICKGSPIDSLKTSINNMIKFGV
jgi:sugar phosphate isomerase/epimerase